MRIFPVNLATFENFCGQIYSKSEISDMWFFVWFSTVDIFLVNMAPSEGGGGGTGPDAQCAETMKNKFSDI